MLDAFLDKSRLQEGGGSGTALNIIPGTWNSVWNERKVLGFCLIFPRAVRHRSARSRNFRMSGMTTKSWNFDRYAHGDMEVASIHSKTRGSLMILLLPEDVTSC